MIIILAAGQVDLDALNELVRQYDVARLDSERERVLDELDKMIGNKVKGTLRQRLRSFNLQPDEINNLAHEALDFALKGVGRIRYRKNDIQAEDLVRQMTSSGNPIGHKLWGLLSEELRQSLTAPYLKQDVENQLRSELTTLINRPDLAEELGIGKQSPTDSARETNLDNARMLESAFPGAINPVDAPPVHLLGYLEKEVIRNIVGRETRERGQISPELMRVWRSIQPVVEQLRGQSSGAMPSVDEVVAAYRQGLVDRYGPAIDWWEEQLRLIGRPFKLKDPRSYSDAKNVLEEHGYDSKQWTNEDSTYYVSKEALKPFGRKVLEQALTIPGLASPRPQSPRVPLEQTPAPSTPPTEPQAPSWAMQMGQQGRGGELYRAMVEALYPDTQSVERQVGEFLATFPSPTDEDVEAFLDELAQRNPEAAALARASWPEIVRRVDRAIIDGLGDQRLMLTMSEQFGFLSMAGVRFDLRKAIFIRTTGLLRRYAS